ncbi:MAG: helix-turn-helix transcriptional regulator [Burkholderiales bacterium]|nr:helix-turn-helix transcriptional regulator [Burkholderiales bacterium]
MFAKKCKYAYHECMNQFDARARAIRAASQARAAGLTQNQIANATGVDQSQVSRILSGQCRRSGSALEKVCKYVESASPKKRAPSVLDHPELTQAILSVWDGTERQARALALVIRSLSALRGN